MSTTTLPIREEPGPAAEFKSAGLLVTVLESLPDGVFMVNDTGRVILFNSAAEQVFRISASEIIGEPATALLGEKYGNLGHYIGGDPNVPKTQGKRFLPLALADGSTSSIEITFCPTKVDGVALVVVLAREAGDSAAPSDGWLETEERLGNFAANMPGIVFQRVLMQDGTLYYPFFSAGTEEILGHSPEDLTVARDGCLDAIHWADRDSYLAEVSRSGETLTVSMEEFRCITRSGEVKWLSGSAQPQTMPNGDVLWDGVLIDVTDRKRAELWLEMIMNHAADGIITITEDGLIESANASMERVFGYDSGELTGLDAAMLMPDPDRTRYREALRRHIAIGDNKLIGAGAREMRGLRKDGTLFTMEVVLSEVLSEGRRIFIAVIRDISQRKETETQLAQTRQSLQNITNNIPGLVYQRTLSKSGDFGFDYVSGGVEDILGIEVDALLDNGELFLDAMDLDDREQFLSDLRRSAERLTPMEDEVKIRSESGEERWLRGWSRPHRLPNGDVVWEGIALDVTDRHRAERRITFLAYNDPLTGLGNRSLFIESFQDMRAIEAMEGMPVAVLSLGLDRFSIINATIGHTMGDKVLIGAARRIAESLMPGDLLCRASGDRFLLLMTSLESEDQITERVEALIKAFHRGLVIEDQQFDLTISIGGTVYPKDGTEPESLIMHADAALHRAKASGGDAYQMFTAEMGQRAAQQLTMQNRIRRALEKEEFVAFFQPQVDARTGAIVGCEALARWRSAEEGLIPPGKFIPVAEEFGLIDAICEQVLADSCRAIAEWQQQGLPPITVAVNISGRQFHNSRTLIKIVEESLETSGIDPQYLELELTESSAMNDPTNAINVVNMFAERGIACSIDDFGTGYSSLSVLKQFPIRKLKVDRSFVKDVTTNSNDGAIVQAIIAMAHALNLKVVAEGVETLDHLNFLKSVECDTIQGYLYAAPLPEEDMAAMLRAGNPEPKPS
ncbi:MAG: EAL domain-containing protein [Rhodospirillaceae bacterium]